MPIDPSILRGVFIGDLIDRLALPKTPLWASEYTTSVLRSRALWANVLTPRMIDLIQRAYAEALFRIWQDAQDGILTADRAEQMARSIRRNLERFELQFGAIGGDGSMAVSRLAANGHKRGLEAARRAAGVSIETSFTEVPGQAIELMNVRRGLFEGLDTARDLFPDAQAGQAAAMRTMIHRWVESSIADMDKLITEFVTIGRSWTDATRDVAGILARGDTDLMQAMVKHLGARGGRLRNEISQEFWRDIDQLAKQSETYASIIKSTKIRSQTLLFDSRRITITEINTAHWEADRVAAIASPVVQGILWTLSGRHAAIGIPCECDVLANLDNYGLGPGVYYPETCPTRPHQFCGCVQRNVLRKPEDWSKPKAVPGRPRELSASTIEDFLNQAHDNARIDKPASVTDKRVKRVLENVNGLQLRSYEVWAKVAEAQAA